ncbi:Transcriptional regulator RutR of pyrimidine catabolism (TetR family) [Cupriavidus basilensis]|uniref:Transcriptional regulator RutR of pyrimidine catabolism (TetR family) n=1 Tax=Cupriavidus basilensis TaxID=68895 RepID=A0A0C4Y7E9_9BURK|nr:Transcriptional regulator RutR of pyrimidine catabolism (TetR family) [Cupriavidus basilensis]
MTAGLKEIDPVMLLYMITAIAQVPHLLTSEMRYAHGINAMRKKAKFLTGPRPLPALARLHSRA